MTDDAKRETGEGRAVHANVYEYDGSFRCIDCGFMWGALPGHPQEPQRCDKARCVAVRGLSVVPCGLLANHDLHNPSKTLGRKEGHLFCAEPAAPPRNAPLTEEMYPWLTAPPRADDDVADAIRTAEGATSRLLREQRAARDRQIAELRAEIAAKDALIFKAIELAKYHRRQRELCIYENPDDLDELIDALAAEGDGHG